VLTKSSASPRVFSLIKGTALLIIMLIVLPVLPLGSIRADVWIYIAASGAIHAVYILALSSAYETGDISYVYPIARSAPALVPIAAFFVLGERISLRGGIGIAIVVAFMFLIQLRGEPGTEIKRLWISIGKKDSVWAFVTLGAVVSYSLVDKAGMVALGRIKDIPYGLHGPVFFILETTLCQLLFWIYMGARGEVNVPSVWKREWPRAVVAAIGTMASYSLILHVMQQEAVGYIVALRQASVLLAVLFGWIALKEPYGIVRLISAAGMLIGFFMISAA
jgi:uncharacterized membrane protein